MNRETLSNTIKQYAPTGNVWSLSGPRNKARRQSIMFDLTGQSLPLAKCGVNAVRDTICKLANVEPGSIAAEDTQIRAIVLGEPS